MRMGDRRAAILRELNRYGSLNVSEFAERIRTSGMTIRRDLAALEDEGLLERVHGGAVTVPAPSTRMRQLPGAGGSGEHGGGRAPLAQAAYAPRRNLAHAGSPVPVATIGMVVPSATYYFPSIIRGAEAAARDLGVRLVLAVSNYSHVEERRQIERLLSHGVDGLLVTPVGESADQRETLTELSNARVPAVIAERSLEDVPGGVPLDSVRSDHERGAQFAVQHLIEQDHERIGLCVRTSSPTAVGVREGFASAMERAGLTEPDQSAPVRSITVEHDRPEELRAQLSDIVDWVGASGFTAVLVHNDEDALTFVDVCQTRGIAIPGDLAIVAYDDEIAAKGAVPLTAVAPPKYDVGYQALQMCLSRVASWQGSPMALQRVSLCPILVVRSSSVR